MKIYLCGFMASGKSKLGRQIASNLKFDFLDLDKLIEKNAGLTIAGIFEKSGEIGFRRLESSALRSTKALDNVVISLGGGACCSEENMDFILENGMSIYLKVEEDIIYGRLKVNRKNRPLVAGLNEADLKRFISEKLSDRLPFYERCTLIFDPVKTSLSFLLDQLQNYSR